LPKETPPSDTLALGAGFMVGCAVMAAYYTKRL
jgi:hypothetical protein